MAKETDSINEADTGLKTTSAAGENNERKKVFVEPTISVPVDVLEATTFFQAATSGGLN